LREIKEGQNWSDVSKSAFDGQGSMGNGAAMRVCPIGAYHYNNFQKVKLLAIQSAEVTHSNIEAITGAIAIAIGTALTTKMKLESRFLRPLEFIDKILEELPDSDTKSKISKAKTIPYNYQIETVKSILGNGSNMTAQDTVPFAIWCAAYNLENFEEALWKGVSILGDRDTICAMVGGITIMSTRTENIPNNWITAVEKFETSIFRAKKIT
jgi:ADP-ribosylglycohydrolase